MPITWGSGLAVVTPNLVAEGFVTVSGVETLTNKTLIAPVAIAGTISGAVTISSVILGSTLSGSIDLQGALYGGIFSVTPTVFTPTDGSTVTLSAGQTNICLTPGGVLATLTVVLPPSPVNGQPCGFSTTRRLTLLTLSGGPGISIVGTVTTLLASDTVRFTYRLTNSTWYRSA